MANNVVIYLLLALFVGCIPVTSTESRARRRNRYGYYETTQGLNTSYQTTSYGTPNPKNSNEHQMYWQWRKRKLADEIINEVVPITKEYGSASNVRNGKSNRGNGSKSSNIGKGTSEGKNSGKSTNGKGKGSESKGIGSSKGKGKSKKNMSKGGKENKLPRICNNFTNMEGSGKGASKSKSKSKGSTKNRVLKGTKGKGKLTQMTKGKGKTSDAKCSKFEYGVKMQRRSLYSRYANLLNIAREIPEISVFMSLLNRFNLSYILECEGPYTGLIPTNDAFGLLDPILFADLLLPTSRDEVERLILNHLFPGVRADADFIEGTILSLIGTDVTVSVDPLVFNNIAMTKTTDIFGSNGVLHLIDRVLLAKGTTVIFENM
jgi:uncharacterized surface protein with fasciclin (FAS1) repeats